MLYIGSQFQIAKVFIAAKSKLHLKRSSHSESIYLASAHSAAPHDATLCRPNYNLHLLRVLGVATTPGIAISAGTRDQDLQQRPR